MKNNLIKNKLHWVYLSGFFIILALPILTIPPWFFPPDWPKTIIFRCIMAIFLLLFTYQFFYKKQELDLPLLKNNRIIWALGGLFGFFLLASIFSVDPYFSFWGSPSRSGGFVNFAFYIIFALFTFFVVKEKEWKRLLNWSIFVAIGVSGIALIQYFGLFKTIFATFSSRPPSTIGNPILLGIYLLLLVFVTLVFFIKATAVGGVPSGGEKKRWALKIAYGLSLMLFLFVILITGSRATYLGLVIGIVYFLLFYPKKLRLIKITVLVFLIIIGGIIFYTNTQSHFPDFLEKNRVFDLVKQRLSVDSLLNEGRFSVWPVGVKAFLQKPLLGWGPENYSVGFNKYYDGSVGSKEGSWWDRAHNVPLEIATTAGLPTLATYLALFIVLFWQLHKLRYAKREIEQHSESTLISHGIQATLIAYFIANIFSFDSFPTYIMFFLLIGYSLRITLETGNSPLIPLVELPVSKKGGGIAICILFFIMVIFLWQYNIVPFFINARVNQASAFIDQKNCTQGLSIMEDVLKKHSFLDSYVRLEYGEFIKKCVELYPENTTAYMQKGVQIMTEAVKIQPLYVRYWVFLDQAKTILANQEQNSQTKSDLLKGARYDIDQAFKLTPHHPEVFIEKAKIELAAQDYQKAESYSQDCVAQDSNLGDCYWYLGLSKIYQKQIEAGKKDIQTAQDKKYNTSSVGSLNELANAYGSINDYQNLVLIYEKLVIFNNVNPQYHSSLAYFYSKLGQYKKAREEAMIVLKLSPESKPNVEAFLKTLPY